MNTRNPELPVPWTFGPPSRVADGKTPRCEKPEFCGIIATASVRDVPPARWLLDLSELGGVLMSIVSGESAIGSGSIGLAMALYTRQGESLQTHVGSNREGILPKGEN